MAAVGRAFEDAQLLYPAPSVAWIALPESQPNVGATGFAHVRFIDFMRYTFRV
jgi:hypothetical protein